MYLFFPCIHITYRAQVMAYFVKCLFWFLMYDLKRKCKISGQLYHLLLFTIATGSGNKWNIRENLKDTRNPMACLICLSSSQAEPAYCIFFNLVRVHKTVRQGGTDFKVPHLLLYSTNAPIQPNRLLHIPHY